MGSGKLQASGLTGPGDALLSTGIRPLILDSAFLGVAVSLRGGQTVPGSASFNRQPSSNGKRATASPTGSRQRPAGVMDPSPLQWDIQIAQSEVTGQSLDPEVGLAPAEATQLWVGWGSPKENQSTSIAEVWLFPAVVDICWRTVTNYPIALPPDFHGHGLKLVRPCMLRHTLGMIE